MTMISSFERSEEKIKKSLFSLEMEQSLIFKDKKNNDKLSPWQEKKTSKFKQRTKSIYPKENEKCSEFLKKVLFKVNPIGNKRVQTEELVV